MGGWRYEWIDSLDPDVYAILIEELNKDPDNPDMPEMPEPEDM